LAHSSYIPGKSTPLLLCKIATTRLMANSEDRRFAFDVRWIARRNRAAIFSDNHEGKKG
jgi:hypothetical protein